MKRCVIMAAGPVNDYDYLSNMISEEDFIICADGGLRHLERIGQKPDLLIGDFDSLDTKTPSDDTFSNGKFNDIPVLKYKKEKDETDTILAIQYALKKGYRNFVILGGLNGRLDHTFANFNALYYIIKNGGAGALLDGGCEVYLIENSSMKFKKRDNYYVSVFPFSQKALGVTEKGLKYPLTDAVLTNDFPIGVSNEFMLQEAEISVKNGSLLIMLSKE